MSVPLTWCRRWETARQMGLGEVIEPPSLDSVFRDRDDAEGRTATTRELIQDWDGQGMLVLAIHQVNISALIRSGVGSGDIIAANPEGQTLEVVGRLR